MKSALKKKKSSRGSKSKGSDGDASGSENGSEPEEEQLEIVARRSEIDVWAKGGVKRSHILGSLIQSFGNFVVMQPKEGALPDYRGRYKEEDKEYSKLFTASMAVFKAQKLLRENDNPETREFTILVAKQRWVEHQLRPLLELCRKDDGITAMRCCKLGLTLMRQIDDKTLKILNEHGKKKRSQKMDEADAQQGDAGGQKVPEDSAATAAKEKLALTNAKEQLTALLAFKEGLCSALCNDAISNLFRASWSQAQAVRTSSTADDPAKNDVAATLFYVRRVLAIEPHADWCSPAEMKKALSIHNQYIVQLRPILLVMGAFCADITDRYHDAWLKDIILILSSIMRDFDPKDLFRVWRDGALLSLADNTDASSEIAATTDHSNTSTLAQIAVPDSIRKSDRTDALPPGALSASLAMQRNQRATLSQNSARNNRFAGVFKVNSSTLGGGGAASGTTESAEGGSLSSGPAPSIIVRGDPLGSGNTLPQAPVRRSKKNLTFAVDKQQSEKAPANTLASEEGQQACVVVATLVNMLVTVDDMNSFPGINRLIHRVNDDLRRDDLIIDKETELKFFQIVSKALMFNRLKLAEQKRQLEVSRSSSSSSNTGKNTSDSNSSRLNWQPDLRNVFNALDKISFNRVTTTLERLSFEKNYREVVYAMDVYKEQVCYLRILCESDNDAHNQVALAGLYRVFYASSQSDRIDPLPKLLQSWRPGAYDKRHLFSLVELVHETMKTLDTARTKFDEYTSDPRYLANKKKKRADVDLELYISSFLGFQVEEYFKRLVTNTSVRMYTKLLRECVGTTGLEPHIVHYIYTFMARMCNLRMEQRYPAPSPTLDVSSGHNNSFSSTSTQSLSQPMLAEGSAATGTMEPLILGYMLFNVQTFMAFNEVLNDPIACSRKPMEPLVRLIKMMVRKFVDLSRKNRMVFVEMLFQHTRPHDVCASIDNLYEATSYYSAERGRLNNANGSSNKQGDRKKQHRAESISDSDSDSDSDSGSDSKSNASSSSSSEEEFDDEVAARTEGEAAALLAERNRKKEEKERAKREKQALVRQAKRELKAALEPKLPKQRANPKPKPKPKRKRANKKGDGSSDDGFHVSNDESSDNDGTRQDNENEGMGDGGGDESARKKSRPVRAAAAAATARRKRNVVAEWSLEEDDILRELFSSFIGSAHVFEQIAHDPRLKEIGNNRKPDHIERRVMYLGLHLTANHDDDDLDLGLDTQEELPEDMFEDVTQENVEAAINADEYFLRLRQGGDNDDPETPTQPQYPRASWSPDDVVDPTELADLMASPLGGVGAGTNQQRLATTGPPPLPSANERSKLVKRSLKKNEEALTTATGNGDGSSEDDVVFSDDAAGDSSAAAVNPAKVNRRTVVVDSEDDE